eukprot:TRINITY_DN2261_c0_g1_i1.p1 TRINITY_DN2261_c0_g1~~TRINITY_DN2261_c0_g1_i1.p1  ORF type:complete len:637 (+),score=137.37 TRINITY_DN2261_c0_g1_i1:794-2704(+)
MGCFDCFNGGGGPAPRRDEKGGQTGHASMGKAHSGGSGEVNHSPGRKVAPANIPEHEESHAPSVPVKPPPPPVLTPRAPAPDAQQPRPLPLPSPREPRSPAALPAPASAPPPASSSSSPSSASAPAPQPMTSSPSLPSSASKVSPRSEETRDEKASERGELAPSPESSAGVVPPSPPASSAPLLTTPPEIGRPVPVAAKTFEFHELERATKNFSHSNFVGEGGFGRVYKGKLESTGQIVAVKQLDRNGLQGNREFLVEVLMLSLLHHPNLVQLIGYCADGDQRLLVYEFMAKGCLEDHLHDLGEGQEPLDWNTRMKVAAGAARGLEYLHDKANPPVIYRDFKSSNILLDEQWQPKLSDFGLAKLGPVGPNTHVSTRVMGTYGYCAPEYAMTGQLTLKSDVYSFGVVLLELITGRKAIDNTRGNGEHNLVAWARPLFKDRRKFPSMADPLLRGQYPMRSLYQALAVAAMCLQEQASIRPVVADVVTALSYLAAQNYTPDSSKNSRYAPEVPDRDRRRSSRSPAGRAAGPDRSRLRNSPRNSPGRPDGSRMHYPGGGASGFDSPDRFNPQTGAGGVRESRSSSTSRRDDRGASASPTTPRGGYKESPGVQAQPRGRMAPKAAGGGDRGWGENWHERRS